MPAHPGASSGKVARVTVSQTNSKTPSAKAARDRHTFPQDRPRSFSHQGAARVLPASASAPASLPAPEPKPFDQAIRNATTPATAMAIMMIRKTIERVSTVKRWGAG